ncbi:hypothetical protein EPUS_01216 [Endocarpon pusillum Z07020]|uniref:Uncharacterized protein n=1 Tax=Endocarpon pusillum (strain Z07020 / HMAS-L-300199) TaxID=1263415 RepID=U1HYB5_ENDPU|nr:uncharacterized protein EPUS_01216 [Endocarpon pusillum Z07020]ERF75850.1 hypothetical protein EPUS_01216 [Endocarpon pusillum Z07020]
MSAASKRPRRPRSRNDFEIAVICAIRIECDAVEALFDEFWEDYDSYGKALGDPNAYSTGRIGSHNVVLAFMPGMGKGTSASVAASFRSSFPNIKLGLVVGICGAVPTGWDDETEILLGDVIISTGLVQYDFGRLYPNKVIRKDTLQDNLAYLREICSKESFEKSKYPGPEEDKLYPSTYRHKHHDPTTCPTCLQCLSKDDEVCDVALESACVDLKGDEKQLLHRDRLQKARKSAMQSAEDGAVIEPPTGVQTLLIHFGLIASGNLVIKSGYHRDDIAAREKVIAFEMEGAGVWDNFPTIVIKGVCDYADSHKNKKWQRYAAATAAACMKAILKGWRTSDKPADRDTYRQGDTLLPVTMLHEQLPAGNSLNTGSREISFGSQAAAQIKHVGHYSHSSLRPVANYIQRPALHKKIQEQLHDRLEHRPPTAKVLVVRGLGGAGKSQLVLHYVQECRPDYRAVFWIESGRKQTIERDYLQLYRQLFRGGAGTGQDMVKLEDAVLAVKNYFRSQTGRYLVVLDSADSIDNEQDESYVDLTFFIPDAPNVDVIITTRSARAEDMSPLEVVHVAEMKHEEARKLFIASAKLKNVTEEVEAQVDLITNELGCLARAITLAGSHVAATPRLSSDLRRYLPEYQTKRKRLLGRKPIQYIHHYRDSVLSTWETSFEAVAAVSTVASQLLTFMAFLNFDDIFLGLFGLNNDDFEQPAELGSSDSQSGDAFDNLIHRLSKVDNETGAAPDELAEEFSSVESLRNDEPDESADDLSTMGSQTDDDLDKLGHELNTSNSPDRDYPANSVQDSSTGDGQSSDNLNQAIQRLSIDDTQWQSLISLNDPLDLDTIESAFEVLRTHSFIQWEDDRNSYSMHKLVHAWAHDRLDVQEQYRLSLGALHLLAEVVSTVAMGPTSKMRLRSHLLATFNTFRSLYITLDPPDVEGLKLLQGITRFLDQAGWWSDVVDIQRFCSYHFKHILGKWHCNTITNTVELGVALGKQGRFEESEKILRKTLQTCRIAWGKQHPGTMATMNNLAIVLLDQGKLEEARKMYHRTLRTRKMILGKQHPDTLISMEEVATTLMVQGKLKEAEEMFREILAWRGKVLGMWHYNTLQGVENLAATLGRQGRHKEAEEIFRMILERREQILGKWHPDTLHAAAHLAFSQGKQNRDEEAEELFQQTILRREMVLGKEHPDTLINTGSLAATIADQGRYKEAEELQRQTALSMEMVLGKEHSDTLRTTSSLAATIANQGRYEEAEGMFRQTALSMEMVLGKEHSDTLRTTSSLAATIANQGRYEEAEGMFRQTALSMEMVLGKEHSDTLRTTSSLAATIANQGRYEEAEGMFRQTALSMEMVLGREHSDTQWCVRLLIRCLKDQGKNEEAAKYEGEKAVEYEDEDFEEKEKEEDENEEDENEEDENEEDENEEDENEEDENEEDENEEDENEEDENEEDENEEDENEEDENEEDENEEDENEEDENEEDENEEDENEEDENEEDENEEDENEEDENEEDENEEDENEEDENEEDENEEDENEEDENEEDENEEDENEEDENEEDENEEDENEEDENEEDENEEDEDQDKEDDPGRGEKT